MLIINLYLSSSFCLHSSSVKYFYFFLADTLLPIYLYSLLELLYIYKALFVSTIWNYILNLYKFSYFNRKLPLNVFVYFLFLAFVWAFICWPPLINKYISYKVNKKPYILYGLTWKRFELIYLVKNTTEKMCWIVSVNTFISSGGQVFLSYSGN